MPETFGGALSGIEQCSQTSFVDAGISLNGPNNSDSYVTWMEGNPPLIESTITQDVLNLSSS